MSKTDAELKEMLQKAVANRNIISLKTYYLSDYGEKVLNEISGAILDKFGRSDLKDIVYTSAKELIINATKANLKRVIFKEMNLDPDIKEDYEKGMKVFKENLMEEKIKKYKKAFKDLNFSVVATFYFQEKVLNIKVKNNFTLYPLEEERIRAKFQKAGSFSSLLDFFVEHGDETEGAGLGLTMVGILLDESGIDRHSFTLFSNKYNETAAKLEIPLQEDYVSRRIVFEEELSKTNMTAEEFRKVFKPPMEFHRGQEITYGLDEPAPPS